MYNLSSSPALSSSSFISIPDTTTKSRNPFFFFLWVTIATRSLSMRRNCNLELRLFPYSSSLPSIDSDHGHPMMEEINNGSPQQKHLEQQQQQQQQQPLTIFYNGKICVSDVTEFQARAILLFANKEIEERMRTTPTGSSPTSPSYLQSQLYSPTAGLSMKRSLQQFLQKRKHRNHQATSPYHHDH